LRLVATHDAGFPDSLPSMRFVLEDTALARTPARPGISPTIDLIRGEPVSITVVNRLGEPTAVHWHGIELESYFDGVAGFRAMGDAWLLSSHPAIHSRRASLRRVAGLSSITLISTSRDNIARVWRAR
jgi:hypothetical protein